MLLHEPIAALRDRVTARVRLEARSPDALRAALTQREVAWTADGDAVLVALDAPRDMPDLLRALLADGVDVFASTPLEVTLEELFLEAVRR